MVSPDKKLSSIQVVPKVFDKMDDGQQLLPGNAIFTL